MPCFSPLTGYRSRDISSNGKRKIVFDITKALDITEVTLPCGQCIGCRLERSRQWAMRCVHEAQCHSDNCFITLTYSDDYLPLNGSLDLSHFQKFMKRLRFKYSPKLIRFFHCGEYGDLNRRPHYHACLFGHDFDDKILWSIDKDSNRLYISKILSDLWGKGYCTVGSLTFETAAYTARYILKKVTGDLADDHYLNIDPVTGECHKLLPEYTTMSRRPGIAKAWYDNFKSEVFPSDFVVLNGIKMMPPKFYDTLLEVENPFLFDQIKSDRVEKAELRSEDQTSERLYVREQVKLAQVSLLKRKLD